MNFEFLVEDESTKVALQNLLPKMLPRNVKWFIRSFQGKHDMLNKLPTRLRGYRRSNRELKIVILIDRDMTDCRELKRTLERMAIGVGFTTKSQAGDGVEYQVMNRIAIEELEAWFFGDNPAITKAYPKVSKSLTRKRKYRDPDNIQGGTWEQLELVLKRAGYYRTGLDKKDAAYHISKEMIPALNRSNSFQIFRAGLNHMIQNMDRQVTNGVIGE